MNGAFLNSVINGLRYTPQSCDLLDYGKYAENVKNIREMGKARTILQCSTHNIRNWPRLRQSGQLVEISVFVCIYLYLDLGSRD